MSSCKYQTLTACCWEACLQRVPRSLNRRVGKGAGACAGDMPTRAHVAQSFEARAPSFEARAPSGARAPQDEVGARAPQDEVGARAPQDEVRAFAHPTR